MNDNLPSRFSDAELEPIIFRDLFHNLTRHGHQLTDQPKIVISPTLTYGKYVKSKLMGFNSQTTSRLDGHIRLEISKITRITEQNSVDIMTSQPFTIQWLW